MCIISDLCDLPFFLARWFISFNNVFKEPVVVSLLFSIILLVCFGFYFIDLCLDLYYFFSLLCVYSFSDFSRWKIKSLI